MSALRPTETGGDLMPSTYAHRRFGADVLQQLPAALQDQIGKNRARKAPVSKKATNKKK